MESLKVIILLSLLTLFVIIFLSMIAFEKYAAYQKRKKIKQIQSLKANDVIKIWHPVYDDKAIFKALVDDNMHIIITKNGVMDSWAVISASCFVKKL